MTERKLKIPYGDSHLVGVLHRAEPNASTKGRPICVMVHGVFAHKDQLWHRQLVQQLSTRRSLDSFRFDFGGCGESPGFFSIPGYEQEIADLRHVVDWLEAEYGYRLHLLIAHSRGVMTALEYVARHRRDLPLFVNISGRFTMSDIYGTMDAVLQIIDEQGFYELKVEFGDLTYGGKITRENIDEYASWPIAKTLASFPPGTDVLNIQGKSDDTVRWTDANIFQDVLSRRTPGTSRVRFVDDATHTYHGHFEEVVGHVLSFLAECDAPPRQDVNVAKL